MSATCPAATFKPGPHRSVSLGPADRSSRRIAQRPDRTTKGSELVNWRQWEKQWERQWVGSGQVVGKAVAGGGRQWQRQWAGQGQAVKGGGRQWKGCDRQWESSGKAGARVAGTRTAPRRPSVACLPSSPGAHQH